MNGYTTSSLSIHLLIDIQVSSMSWLLWIALLRHRGACIFSNYSFLWKYAQKWDCRMLSSAAQSHGLQHARLPVHHQLQEFTQTHAHRVGDAIQPSHPLSSPPPPALIFPKFRVFSSESALRIRWPKYWSFSFSISPSSEHPGLISFRMDWLDLFAVQGTCKSLLQHHSSKASALWHSGFFIAQLSHPCMITRKTIALTRWTFVGKVMSLLFNMLSRLVIAFLPRSKHLYFMAAITICSDFGAQENKASHSFHCFPIYFPWSDGTGCHDLSFLNVEL